MGKKHASQYANFGSLPVVRYSHEASGGEYLARLQKLKKQKTRTEQTTV